MFRENIVSFFLGKINVDLFSDLVKANFLFQFPYKLFAQQLIDFNFPQHLFLEATNNCNLRCNMCSRNTKKQDLGFMDLNLFKKVVDESVTYGSKGFCLHIFGEPLLAPDAGRMLEYIKLKNPNNVIILTTNGILLDEKISHTILEMGVDRLVVSVIAARGETYKKVTQSDCLEKVETNVKSFLLLKKLKRKLKPQVFVRMLKNEDTFSEEELFINKWSKFSVSIHTREAHNYAGKIKNNIFRKAAKRYPCYHLWFSPAINYQGDMSICCCDWAREATLGNVNKDSVSNIWRSEMLRSYRLYHLNGQYEKIPLCKDCDVWSTYPDIFFSWQKKPRHNN